ncbi:MAG TPA: hypothetical protein VF134_08635 [Candidatus Dormibacteraeota bacterium]
MREAMMLEHEAGRLTPGTQVWIRSEDSPFDGRVGIIHHLTRQGRVFVAFPGLVIIQFGPDEIQPLD